MSLIPLSLYTGGRRATRFKKFSGSFFHPFCGTAIRWHLPYSNSPQSKDEISKVSRRVERTRSVNVHAA